MSGVKIMLVDDHALLRETLAEALQRESEFVVTDSLGTADEALRNVRVQQPDVIVMDIDMPGMICFDAAGQISSEFPDIRFIFLSAHTHDHYIEEALRVGALGYLTKAEPPERLVSAISEVSQGRAFFSDSVLDRIVFDGDKAHLANSGKSRISTLTQREVEILRYLARGLAKKDIAAIIHVSVKTVDKHTENLMRKLNINDRVELARFAFREGISEP